MLSFPVCVLKTRQWRRRRLIIVWQDFCNYKDVSTSYQECQKDFDRKAENWSNFNDFLTLCLYVYTGRRGDNDGSLPTFSLWKIVSPAAKINKKSMLNRVNIYPGIFNSDRFKLIEWLSTSNQCTYFRIHTLCDSLLFC